MITLLFVLEIVEVVAVASRSLFRLFSLGKFARPPARPTLLLTEEVEDSPFESEREGLDVLTVLDGLTDFFLTSFEGIFFSFERVV